jgi:hypothetical protein
MLKNLFFKKKNKSGIYVIENNKLIDLESVPGKMVVYLQMKVDHWVVKSVETF